LGNEARIKLKLDADNYFILNVFVNIDVPKNITVTKATQIMKDYLVEEKIIQPYVDPDSLVPR